MIPRRVIGWFGKIARIAQEAKRLRPRGGRGGPSRRGADQSRQGLAPTGFFSPSRRYRGARRPPGRGGRSQILRCCGVTSRPAVSARSRAAQTVKRDHTPASLPLLMDGAVLRGC